MSGSADPGTFSCFRYGRPTRVGAPKYDDTGVGRYFRYGYPAGTYAVGSGHSAALSGSGSLSGTLIDISRTSRIAWYHV